MIQEERINKLWEECPDTYDINSMNNFIDTVALEYTIFHEIYEALMDEKTGMSFQQFIP